MKIAADTVVTLHYTIKNTEGSVVETSVGNDPLVYLHGADSFFPVLEAQLAGKTTGDKVTVTVSPDDAYGDRDEELVEVVSRSDFEGEEDLVAGKSFQYEDEDGEVHEVRIVKVEGDDVTVDENHPWAGMTLTFDLEVAGVRAASAEEKAHGHVHGEGGHHH